MATFEIEKEEITALDLGDTYIFKTYFDKDSVYHQLQKYSNDDGYRLEVPESDLEEVEQLHEECYYELQVKDNFEDYSAVAEKGTESSETIRNSVVRKRRGQYKIFVMKCDFSVKQTVGHGAVQIEQTGIQKEELEWKPQRP